MQQYYFSLHTYYFSTMAGTKLSIGFNRKALRAHLIQMTYNLKSVYRSTFNITFCQPTILKVAMTRLSHFSPFKEKPESKHYL